MAQNINKSRRDLLKFLGVSAVGYSITPKLAISAPTSKKLFPTFKDDLVLHPGLNYSILIGYGDKINATQIFGFNNDYIDMIPLSKDEIILWVNHEYHHPLFISGYARTKKNIDDERKVVGGSILKVKKIKNKWTFIQDDKINKGIRGDTPIPFHKNIKIKGRTHAIGTVANCAGGKTPWNTFLTCEENYFMFYGDVSFKKKKFKPSITKWETIYPNPPEHYGWVVEVDPLTAKAKKLVSLGRFSHESATCIKTKDNKVAVYSGDDKEDEYLYKFISSKEDSLDDGVLYCADIINGKWLPLDLEKSPVLKKTFSSHLDMMIHARKAASILGATKLNRPEDIAIHPKTGDVYIALTNNKKKNDFHGSIIRISEKENDHGALSFKSENFLLGGIGKNFTCPDNLSFDQNGNLWFSNDISTKALGNNPYKSFGNNGLFVVPTAGKDKGKVLQLISAPTEAELTGICFSPDQKELFLSVQHPGENTTDLKNPTSTWPSGKIPTPSVVVITGKLLESFTQ